MFLGWLTISAKSLSIGICLVHTCDKLWTDFGEIRLIFKEDLIKFCEIFTKVTLEHPQNSQKPSFKCKKLLINTIKCDLCLFLHKISCKMFWKCCEIWKSYGMETGFQIGQILGDFISQCEMLILRNSQKTNLAVLFSTYRSSTVMDKVPVMGLWFRVSSFLAGWLCHSSSVLVSCWATSFWKTKLTSLVEIKQNQKGKIK